MKNYTVVVLSFVALSLNAFSAPPVIYGEDNRKDLYDVLNPLHRKLADSTVAIMERTALTQNSSGEIKIKTESLEKYAEVCKKERFSDQPVGAFCSGFLVAEDIVVTAGHCIGGDRLGQNEKECASARFVFGYAVNESGKYPSAVPESEVYGCKKVLYRQEQATSDDEDKDGADFGVILLDRKVKNHAPLALSRRSVKDPIERGTRLVMIGHPSGLPTKVDDGAAVRDGSKNGYFVANTDSYGGNSGSAVFNLVTGEVEGVLVRGELDYIRDPVAKCNVSNVCANDGCRGEEITKISSVIPRLPR